MKNTIRSRPWPIVLLVLTLAVSLLPLLAPAVAAADRRGERGVVQGVPSRSLALTHGPTVTTLTSADSDGHQVGDLRVVSLPLTGSGDSDAGRLDASLLTTGIDTPNPGDEIRISTLIFTVGDDPADQVVVTGTGIYPAAGSTLAIDTTVVRPISGGSGRFAGATGWAESEHLADDSWRHTLHFTAVGPGRGVRVPPGLERRGGRDERGGRGDRGARPRSAQPDASQAPIIRTPLGQTDPSTAEGETLGLWHYLIPAGAVLPRHTHPGYQVARVLSGVLTYEVVSGEAQVTRRDGSTETVGAGSTVTLTPGDTIVEPPAMVHTASNSGRRPVVIFSATLFDTGAEPATLVEPAEPEASLAPRSTAQPVESAAA